MRRREEERRRRRQRRTTNFLPLELGHNNVCRRPRSAARSELRLLDGLCGVALVPAVGEERSGGVQRQREGERPFGAAFTASSRFGGVEKHKVNRVVNVSPPPPLLQCSVSLPRLEMAADRYLCGETTRFMSLSHSL